MTNVDVTELGRDTATAQISTPSVPGLNNQAPVAEPDFASVSEDGTSIVTGNVLTNDNDPDPDDSISVFLVNGGAITGAPFDGLFGTLTIDTEGNFTYNLDNARQSTQGIAVGQTATDLFAYQIRDEFGSLATGLLVINVGGANDAPNISIGFNDSAEEGLTEADTGFVLTRQLTVTDPYVFDTVNASVRSVNTIGDTDGLTNSDFLSMFSVGSNPVVGAFSNTGTINWTFDSGLEAFDHLADTLELDLRYTVRATDTSGAFDEQTVRVLLMGTNDDPDITIEIGPGDSAAEGLTETDSGVMVSRTLSVIDLDTTDTVDASVASLNVVGDDDGLGNAALLAMMTVGSNPVIDASSKTGTINWTFDSGIEAFDHLADGEQLELTYMLRATDSPTGASDDQGVLVVILGTNDAPDITVEAVDSDSQGLTETDSGLSVSRTLTVTDLDTTDDVNASVNSVTVTGNADGLSNSAFLAMMTVGTNPVLDSNTVSDSITWTFDSGTEAFDHLAAAETLTLDYTIRATDSPIGAIDDQIVSIVVLGTNDAPDITVGGSDSASASLTESDVGLFVRRTLTVTDEDMADTVTATVQSVTSTGETDGLSNLALLNMLNLNTTTVPVIDGSNKVATIEWTFDSGTEAFDHLADAETL